MKAIRRFSVRPTYPEPLRPLHRLAQNLRWSWHPETRELLRSVDPDGWAAHHGDPVRTLGALTADRLHHLAEDEEFLGRLHHAASELEEYLTEPRWYQGLEGAAPRAIAYLSPEFGITSGLPQYSGGLGILAGDHLKAASDLGVPLIGVGLLYRHGYFRQSLTADGWQQEHYPEHTPRDLPLTALTESDGTPAVVRLTLPEGGTLAARVWQLQVGRVPLLLLDSALEENTPSARETTDRLYGGGSEHRLLQEMLLGIGGLRALRAYCRITGHPEPEVFHMNEGHAGFLAPERIRELGERGIGFDAALRTVRAGTVFTTHTPVPAGIDRFPQELLARYLGPDGALAPLPADRLLDLGREPAAASHEGGPQFNMALLGLRTAQRANGVSALHGRVSREMFAGLWPGFDADEVPITSVTNGVHAPTWTAGAMSAAPVDSLTDTQLWELRRTLRAGLVTEVRRRARDSWRQRGVAASELAWTAEIFDPEVLTIGFARRVPSYKRLTLMLRDPARLRRLLLHPERPVQIVVAGKAHPADEGGKRLIQEFVRFADDPAVRHRLVFLPDYGMAMAAALYAGCDVWLNNPLRPLEACGTSGMKSALNGGLNLSVRDGWWDEWYDPEFGWEIPTAEEGAGQDPEHRDAVEAAALYRLLEEQVAPCFYAARGAHASSAPPRSDHRLGAAADAPADIRSPAEGVATRPDTAGAPGTPGERGWLERVRATLERLGPRVLADRMVQEYVRDLYLPAAAAHRALDPAAAQGLAEYAERVHQRWPGVRIEHLDVEEPGPLAEGSWSLGEAVPLTARVALGGLHPDEVEVQAVVGPVDGASTLTAATTVPLKPSAGGDLEGVWSYTGALPMDRTGSLGCTVRVLPAHPLLASHAELGLVAFPAPTGAAGGDPAPDTPSDG